MDIARDAVLHVARLARLELADDEVEPLARDLGRILDYVAELEELDTTAVPPTAHVALERAPLRPDGAEAGVPSTTALAEAPRSTAGGFAVPAIIDE